MSLYIGLLTRKATPDDLGAEVTDPAYQRVVVRLETDPATLNLFNANPVVFPRASENWPPITAFGVYDKWGNQLKYGALLGGPVAIHAGEVATFASHALCIERERVVATWAPPDTVN